MRTTQAYYNTELIMIIKSFIAQALTSFRVRHCRLLRGTKFCKILSSSNNDFAELEIRLNWGWSCSIYQNRRIVVENPWLAKPDRKMDSAKSQFGEMCVDPPNFVTP